MPLQAREVLAGLRKQEEENAEAAAEAAGTLKPRNQCPHEKGSVWRAVLYKGAKPLNVSYCEDCGALGPASGTPTLDGWASPRAFR